LTTGSNGIYYLYSIPARPLPFGASSNVAGFYLINGANSMNYTKPAHSFEQQAQWLLAYPDIPTYSMGFPPEWKDCPIWK